MSDSTNTEVFVLETGDGDPSFIHMRHEVRFVSETWFPVEILGQEAQLLFVVSGAHQGRYVALTQRGGPIKEQLETRGFVGVVARPVRNPTASFDETRDLDVGGMTILRRASDARFGQ